MIRFGAVALCVLLTHVSDAGAQTQRADTTGLSLIPAGFGTLKLDDIAVKLQFPDVLVKMTPLDESVIRTLSKDSYGSLRDLVESKRTRIRAAAEQRGLRRPSLWYGEFYGLAPDAKFSPLEVTISVSGRDYQPIEVIPITPGFGEQRLALRARQSAIYLFEDAVDVNQPIVVAVGALRSGPGTWTATLQGIERERALIRSRSQPKTTSPNP